MEPEPPHPPPRETSRLVIGHAAHFAAFKRLDPQAYYRWGALSKPCGLRSQTGELG